MSFFLIAFAFFIFSIAYAFFSSAAIYHLYAYTLPGWSGGRIGTMIFVTLSLVLFVIAVILFFQIPFSQNAYLNS